MDIQNLYDMHPKISACIDDYGDYLYLASLAVDDATERGCGYGTAFMRDLCRLADDGELDIEVSPSGESDDCRGEVSYLRLVMFYERFGFYVTSHADRYMMRPHA